MTGALAPQNFPSFGIAQGKAPEGGPKCVPVSVDFTIALSQVVDLQIPEAMEKIEFVQSIWVDNTGNGSALSITVEVSNQTIVMPANCQGYLPVLAPGTAKFTAVLGSATTNTNTPIIFINMPMAPAIWNASNSGSAGNTASSAIAAPAVTAAAYAAGNVIGGVVHFTNIAPAGDGKLTHIIPCVASGATPGAMQFYVFNKQPAGGTYTDNAAVKFTVADINALVSIVNVTPAAIAGAAAGSAATGIQANNAGQPLGVFTGTDLWVVPIATAAITFAATTDFSFNIQVLN